MPRYEVLSHTADTGIETRGESRETVIANAAFAMFDLMFGSVRGSEGGAQGEPLSIRFDQSSPPELLVAVLSELLYRSEVDDVVFADVVVETGPAGVVVTGQARPLGDLELEGAPIKAITYHELRCEQTDDGWYARVIFDV